MDEPAGCAGAQFEDLVVAGLDVIHLLGRDLGVVQRRAPVGPPLEHGQLTDLVSDLADDLHARRAGADHRDPLTDELDRLDGPVVGVEQRPFELVEAFVAWQRLRRQQADRRDQEAARELAAVAQSQAPPGGVVVPVRRLDRAAEQDVPAEVELFGDVLQVTQVLRLAGEALLQSHSCNSSLEKE